MIAFKPARRPGVPMLSNGHRAQMGTPLVLLALKPAIPLILGIVGSGLALWGVSFGLRSEGQKWKEASGLNLSNIPQAVVAGGAGAIALVVGGNLEGTSKVVASSVGIAGIAAAIYLMFSGEPKGAPAGSEAAAAPGAVPEAPKVALYPATVENPAPVWQGDVLSVLKATMVGTGGGRSSLRDQSYEAYVINEGARPISFYAGANIYHLDAGVVFTSDPLTPPYRREIMNLGPKGSGTETATIKVLTPTPDLWKGGDEVKFSKYHGTGVSIEFFRKQNDPVPFYVTNSIPITYSVTGFGV